MCYDTKDLTIPLLLLAQRTRVLTTSANHEITAHRDDGKSLWLLTDGHIALPCSVDYGRKCTAGGRPRPRVRALSSLLV